MRRRLLAIMIVGTGLACGAMALAPAIADDKENKNNKESDSSRKSDDGAENPANRVDKAIRVYESRADQDLDQTRKEIDRLRKELTELNSMRYDMVISVAELRAEMASRLAAGANGSGDSSESSQGQSDSDSEKSRRTHHAADQARELRQAQEFFRTEVQQVRNLTDQSVTQLRGLRAQLRQAQQQMEANRDKSKKSDNKGQDDKD